METYRRGRTEPHSKCGCREIGTWVRIPPFPPNGRPVLNKFDLKIADCGGGGIRTGGKEKAAVLRFPHPGVKAGRAFCDGQAAERIPPFPPK